MCIFSLKVYATNQCFIAKENGKIVKQIGYCNERHTPFSTFKIPIALMGFDAGILKTPQEPLVKFTPRMKENIRPWYHRQTYPVKVFALRDHTPATWMRYSIIWYSQYMTKKLGVEKFQHYIDQFEYGNKAISDTRTKETGLVRSWLDGPLQISPLEQMNFLEKLSNKSLPVSKSAQENTIKIIKLENIWDEWQLYGKTGGPVHAGWFVGWVEKGPRRIVFAQYIKQPEDALLTGGRVAKEVAKDNPSSEFY